MMAAATKASTRSAARSPGISTVVYSARRLAGLDCEQPTFSSLHSLGPKKEHRKVFIDLDQMSENVRNGAASVWRRRKMKMTDYSDICASDAQFRRTNVRHDDRAIDPDFSSVVMVWLKVSIVSPR